MSCGRIQNLIHSILDGRASAAETALVEDHLERCAECAAEMESSRRLCAVLRGIPQRRVSDEFEQKLAAAVGETMPHPAPQAWWDRVRMQFDWKLRLPVPMAAFSLAAAVFAAVTAPLLVQYQQRQWERGRMLAVAVERHQQLERAEPRVNWDAMDASIDLSAGHVTTD